MKVATEVKPGGEGSGEKKLFFAVLILAIITYIPTFGYLWGRWMADTQYSLAYLVPLVSGYFIWKKWPEVRKLERSSNPWGLALIVASLLFLIIGALLDISGPSSVSVFMFILGGCLYFHGTALVRTLGFPLAYMVFMIPIPGGLLDMVGFPLQLWASGSTAAMLRLIGMDVVRNGVNMSVPGFDFQVAEACSGMSSLVALVGVTAVFAYITSLPARLKWLLFFLALPIALIANIVRITTIALVGYEWGRDAAMNIFHDWSSPILFMAAVLMLLGLNKVFEWLSENRTTSS